MTNGSQIEFDYYITPDGLTYSFHDNRLTEDSVRFLMLFSGQGMPGISLLQQRGPFQNGVTVLDYRLSPREIIFVHRRRGCDREGYWDIRADILNHLRPNRQAAGQFLPGKLRKILPNGAVRDIDVYASAGPVFEPRTLDRWDEAGVMETLRFFAPDPTFYDPALTQTVVQVQSCDNLVFPFQFPFAFCGGGLIQTDTITYTGTWLSLPTIVIQGPARGALIRNLTTGEKIEFARAIPAGTTVTLDLRYGYKTVTDQLGANWIGGLTEDSDLATFHLAPDPEAAGGVNILSASVSGASSETLITMSFYARYIGI